MTPEHTPKSNQPEQTTEDESNSSPKDEDALELVVYSLVGIKGKRQWVERPANEVLRRAGLKVYQSACELIEATGIEVEPEAIKNVRISWQRGSTDAPDNYPVEKQSPTLLPTTQIETEPEPRSIFDELNRLAHLASIGDINGAVELRGQLRASVKELAEEWMDSENEALALRQAIDSLWHIDKFMDTENLHVVACQYGHIPEVAGLIIDSQWYRRDTLVLLAERQTENPDFLRLLDIYKINIGEAIRAEQAEVAESESLEEISRLGENILTDFGDHMHNGKRLQAQVDAPADELNWPYRPLTGEAILEISKLTPAFYDGARNLKPSWRCYIQYRSGGAPGGSWRDNLSQILLPAIGRNYRGFEVRLSSKGQTGHHLLTEKEAQSLISDLNKFYPGHQ